MTKHNEPTRVEDKLSCLVAYLAATESPPTAFDLIASAARGSGLEKILRELLTNLDDPRLLRRLAKGAYKSVTPLDWDTVVFKGDEVHWNDAPIGRLRVLYKVVFPQETQARLAYEVFLDRFLNHIQRTYKVIVVHESDADVTLFVPYSTDFKLQVAWRTFVAHAFSASGLRQTFVPLVNSIRLSGRGFSTLDIPIVSPDHALYLAAFYRANLASIEARDTWRRKEIARLQQELRQAQNAKDKTKLKKNIVKLENELETRRKRYGEAYHNYELLKKSHPVWINRVEAIARKEMGKEAGRQLSQRRDIVDKYVREMEALAKIDTDNFFQPPPLLVEDPFVMKMRGAGDANGEACYACGHVFARGEKKFKPTFRTLITEWRDKSGEDAPFMAKLGYPKIPLAGASSHAFCHKIPLHTNLDLADLGLGRTSHADGAPRLDSRRGCRLRSGRDIRKGGSGHALSLAFPQPLEERGVAALSTVAASPSAGAMEGPTGATILVGRSLGGRAV